MRAYRLLAITASVIIATLGIGVAPAQADTQDFYFSDYDAHYFIEKLPNGHAQASVIETLTAQFPASNQNHGIIRDIPLSYQNIDTPITVQSVTNQNGTPYAYTTATSNGQLELKIGNANTYLHGATTFVLHYTVLDPVRDFANTNSEEFYWNTNGFGWQQRFDHARVTIQVADGVAGALTGQYACYYGAAGSTSKCDIARQGNNYIANAPGSLPPKQNLTVAIGFQPGTFVIPQVSPWRVVLVNIVQILTSMSFIIIFGILLVFALIAGALYKQLHRYRTPTVVPEYVAPTEQDLYAINNVLQELAEHDINADGARAFSATILRMAINKNINLLDRGNGNFAFALTTQDGLTVPERQVLAAFANRQGVDGSYVLTTQDVNLGESLRAIGRNRGIDLGYLYRGDKAPWYFRLLRALFHLVAIAGLVATIAGPVLGIPAASSLPLAFLVIIYIVYTVLPKSIARVNQTGLTPTGKKLADYMNGMRMYIEVAEKDRIKFLQSVKGAERTQSDGASTVVLLERLLPYAVLLGLEKSWAAILDDLYKQYAYTPTWNPTGYSTALLASSLTHGIAQTYSYTPPSSSSGGAGGGGFSGGGGGGGGGGGW